MIRKKSTQPSSPMLAQPEVGIDLNLTRVG
jgi:hypothetical protein